MIVEGGSGVLCLLRCSKSSDLFDLQGSVIVSEVYNSKSYNIYLVFNKRNVYFYNEFVF